MGSFIRNRIAAGISPSDVDFARRGFSLERPVARRRLEERALAFVTGARALADGMRPAHDALSDLEPDLRGFGYEGAGMTAALLDIARPGRSPQLGAVLGGNGYRYRHLVHVGVGWAMSLARLPSPALWGNLDPLLRWLALDGAGFRRMFFGTAMRLAELRIADEPISPTRQVLVQGSGRALWFVRSASLDCIAETIDALPSGLAPHLWSGIGLAAGYAGDDPPPRGCDLLAAAGRHADHLAQGVLFAAAARHSHGHVPDHTDALLSELLQISTAEAADWADVGARDLVVPGQTVSGYLEWRRRLRIRTAERLGHGTRRTPTPHTPHTTRDGR